MKYKVLSMVLGHMAWCANVIESWAWRKQEENEYKKSEYGCK